MKQKYCVVFVVPTESEMLLGDYGWEVISDKRLSQEVEQCVLDTLGVTLVGGGSDLKEYRRDDVAALCMLDENGLLENVYVRSRDASKVQKLLEIREWLLTVGAVLFMPGEC